MKTKEKFKNFINKTLDIVFPDNISCIFCGKDVIDGDICPSCKEKFVFNSGNRCVFCDCQIKEGNIVCDHCKTAQPLFKKCFCPFVYNEDTRSSILKLKSDSAKYLAKYFAKHIYDRLIADGLVYDIIVPVPSHKKTIKKRGYNPAQALAEQLSKLSGKPMQNLLIKTALTKNQKFLNFKDRQNNLENSITITDVNSVKNKIVLIVDDIITTGETINACAKLMHKSKEIYACAIARRNI